MEIDPLHRPILLAIDEQTHTESAIRWACCLAVSSGVELVALHVQDRYLKQFSNEIYAQGREEYLEHVDHCLMEISDGIARKFDLAASSMGVRWSLEVRQGHPLDELVAELARGDYSLLVMGQKSVGGLQAWRSENLAGKLVSKRLGVPILVVGERR